MKAERFVEEEKGRFSVNHNAIADTNAVVNGHDYSTEALLERWSRRLKAGERRMLAVLVADTEALDRAELGERSGVEPSSGTFSTYLGHLKRNALVVEDLDGLSANPIFYGVLTEWWRADTHSSRRRGSAPPMT